MAMLQFAVMASLQLGVYLINRAWWYMYMKLYEALLQKKNSFRIDVFNWKSKKQPIPKDPHYNGPAVVGNKQSDSGIYTAKSGIATTTKTQQQKTITTPGTTTDMIKVEGMKKAGLTSLNKFGRGGSPKGRRRDPGKGGELGRGG